MDCTQLISNRSAPMFPICIKKVAEEAHNLTVDPIHNLTEDSVGDKIPYEHLIFTSFITSGTFQVLISCSF